MKKRNKKSGGTAAGADAGTTNDAATTSDVEAAAGAGEGEGAAPEEATQPYVEVPAFEEAPDTEVGASVVPETGEGESAWGEAAPAPEPVAASEFDDTWDGPTTEAAASELAALAAASTEIDGEVVPESPAATGRLESVLESLLFASDRPLTVAELKRLVGERDTGKVTEALEALKARRDEQQSGIQVASVAGGWQLRTHPDNAAWVSRLIAGRPQRLSRAMLETLAIVAYRQPITRPEIDDIRGVDCGPVLKTLLDRALVRMIGKKEDVGRPILYGTTPEFLRVFSLRDLSELPTLREFHELGAAEMAKVDAEAPPAPGADAPAGEAAAADAAAQPAPAPRRELTPEEDDELLSELERATAAAAKAAEVNEPGQRPPEGGAATTTD
jgi:segregation and condensation protein B